MAQVWCRGPRGGWPSPGSARSGTTGVAVVRLPTPHAGLQETARTCMRMHLPALPRPGSRETLRGGRVESSAPSIPNLRPGGAGPGGEGEMETEVSHQD